MCLRQSDSTPEAEGVQWGRGFPTLLNTGREVRGSFAKDMREVSSLQKKRAFFFLGTVSQYMVFLCCGSCCLLQDNSKLQTAESRDDNDLLWVTYINCWLNHQPHLWIYCSYEIIHFGADHTILVSACLVVENILTDAKVHRP